MVIQLTEEQRRALRSGPVPVFVEHGETCEVYYLIDRESLRQLQRRRDVDAVRQGLDEVDSGRTLSLEQLDARIGTLLDPTNLA